MPRRRQAAPPSTPPRPGPPWRTAVWLFALAFALRLLFWQATADRELPYSALFKGDAPTWLAWAASLRQGVPFELGLPLRPPGAAYTITAIWDGTAAGVATLRLAWAALGALAVALLYVAFRRGFAASTALVAGTLCAGATALLLLAATLDSETPYLVLVAASFCLWPEVAAGRAGALLGWGALQGVACLFRVEHALAAALLGAWLVLACWRGAAAGALVRRCALPLLAFVIALLPWHLHAWRAVAEFNQGTERSVAAAAEASIAAVERRFSSVPWDASARTELARLPAAVRRTAGAFVAATVARRGGDRVTAASFAVLDEAFGYRPRLLSPYPFVALYGPLSFYLGNHPTGNGGFTVAPLAEPPPLVGGSGRYPAALVSGLPPRGLALTYPPHLRLVQEGYALGWQAIAGEPGRWLTLAARKLTWFWQGASLGLGGFGLPLGVSGLRRSVDVTVAQGWWPAIWRLAVLAAAAAGAWSARSRPALAPWLLYAGSKAVVAVAFLGYARHGALVAPVVLLAVSLLIVPRLPADGVAMRRAVLAFALLLVAGETGRWLARPGVSVGGRAVTGREPFSFDDHRPRQVLVRGGGG